MFTDAYAYKKWPHHSMWFSKLWVAEKTKLKCGPAGVAPVEDGVYVVRPVMNLSGMGVGAEVKTISAGDLSSVPSGYFWCEYLRGSHHSIDYTWITDHTTGGFWEQVSCWEGVNMPINLSKFVEWKRSSYIKAAPEILKELSDVKNINVEFIGGKIIEVHLRHSPDPQYDHIIPVWESDPSDKVGHYESLHGYKFIADPDDGDSQLHDPRIGFLVK